MRISYFVEEGTKTRRRTADFTDFADINGRKQKAYALNNDQEYFAESSEAFFGTNDFYPFVKSELKHHDPNMYETLKKLWSGEQN